MPDPEGRMLGPSSFSKRAAAARGMIPGRIVRACFFTDVQSHYQRTHDLEISLLCRSCCAHSVRLASAGLTVRQNGDVVTLHKRVDTIHHVVEDALLIHILAKHTIEHKHLPPARSVHGETRGRGDVTRRRAEALGNKFKARVARLEWRAHADGDSDLGLAIVVRGPALSAVFARADREAAAAPVLVRGPDHGRERPRHSKARRGAWWCGHSEGCRRRVYGDGEAVGCGA
jgi:hypothetical protein